MIIKGKDPEPNTITYGYRNKRFYLDNHVYLPILKNAHRLTTTIAIAYGFKHDDKIDLSNKIKLITLRDPLERWCAGIAQLMNYHFPKLKIDEHVVDLLTKIVILDGHSSSQANYLSGIDTSECVFFNMDDPNYEENFKDYCRRYFGGIVDLNSPSVIKADHFSTPAPRYKEMKQELEMFLTEKFKERLKIYYEEDYLLLNTVKFYTKGGKNA